MGAGCCLGLRKSGLAQEGEEGMDKRKERAKERETRRGVRHDSVLMHE